MTVAAATRSVDSEATSSVGGVRTLFDTIVAAE